MECHRDGSWHGWPLTFACRTLMNFGSASTSLHAAHSYGVAWKTLLLLQWSAVYPRAVH